MTPVIFENGEICLFIILPECPAEVTGYCAGCFLYATTTGEATIYPR
jgi:hypothetical protein